MRVREPAQNMENCWMSMESNSPTVSVIMPSYNHERYIGIAIESILNQTLADFELVIVDDGSVDCSPEIIHRYRDLDARVRPCFHKRNLGIPVTLNDGLAMATGEYVAFIGSDDEWVSHKLERQLEVLSSEPDAVAWSEGLVIDESGRPTGKTFSQFFDAYNRKKEGIIFLELMKGNYICGSSVITRRDHFDNIRFDESVPLLNDYLVMVQLAHEHPWRFIEEPLVKYRWHSGQSIKNYRDVWDKDQAAVYLRLAEEYSDELPGDVRSQLFVNAAGAFSRMGDGMNARRSLRNALEHHPDNMAAQERLLQLDWGICFPDGWRLHAGGDTDALVSEGDTHASADRPGEALRFYEEALAIDRSNVRARVDAAVMLGNLNRTEEALLYLEEACELDAGDPEAWLNRGLCLEDLSRIDESKECYAEVLKIDPGDFNGLGRTGVGLAANGDFEGALVCFEKIENIQQGDVRNMANMAGCLKAMSRFEEALQRYTEALEAAPDDIPCALNEARCLESLGRDEEALQCCERALELLADVRREDAEHMKGLRQSMDGAKQYIEALEEEERKKGVELEKAGEYVRKLEQLIVDQKAALAAVKREDVPRLHYEQQEPGKFGLFKIHVKNEGFSATFKRSLAYAVKKLKRN